MWNFVMHCSETILSAGIREFKSWLSLLLSVQPCPKYQIFLHLTFPICKRQERNLFLSFKDDYRRIYLLITYFIMPNTLCILSHFNMPCTIIHTKDSVKGTVLLLILITTQPLFWLQMKSKLTTPWSYYSYFTLLTTRYE